MKVLLIALWFLVGYVVGESIHLSNVKSLTLRKGIMTIGRRALPTPQLKCVGGNAASKAHLVEVVQCLNMGSGSQWKCEAHLDPSIQLGRLAVSCEGYAYPDDPYILEGSCGLEYHLEYKSPALTKNEIRGVILGLCIVVFCGIVIIAVLHRRSSR